jgi:hypothetical protein
MKTMIYNLQKGIISAILVLIISSVGSAATKDHETPALITLNNSEATMVINESNSSTSGLVAKMSAEATVSELSRRIGDWMSDGSYWETENASEMAEKELAENIQSWISNGSYWSVPTHSHKAEVRLAHKIKSWMSDGSYWGVDED